MPFSPPPGVVEVQGILKKSGQVTLNAAGSGVITFTPDSGWQRWEVTSVTVSTNQLSTATVVPIATLALNAVDPVQSSPGNVQGATYSGNLDTFAGDVVDVGPADFLSVMFTCPAGLSPATLSGVLAMAVINGTKYTRRA